MAPMLLQRPPINQGIQVAFRLREDFWPCGPLPSESESTIDWRRVLVGARRRMRIDLYWFESRPGDDAEILVGLNGGGEIRHFSARSSLVESRVRLLLERICEQWPEWRGGVNPVLPRKCGPASMRLPELLVVHRSDLEIATLMPYRPTRAALARDPLGWRRIVSAEIAGLEDTL